MVLPANYAKMHSNNQLIKSKCCEKGTWPRKTEQLIETRWQRQLRSDGRECLPYLITPYLLLFNESTDPEGLLYNIGILPLGLDGDEESEAMGGGLERTISSRASFVSAFITLSQFPQAAPCPYLAAICPVQLSQYPPQKRKSRPQQQSLGQQLEKDPTEFLLSNWREITLGFVLFVVPTWVQYNSIPRYPCLFAITDEHLGGTEWPMICQVVLVSPKHYCPAVFSVPHQ